MSLKFDSIVKWRGDGRPTRNGGRSWTGTGYRGVCRIVVVVVVMDTAVAADRPASQRIENRISQRDGLI